MKPASSYAVTLLFETHHSWTGSSHVRHIMESVDSEYLEEPEVAFPQYVRYMNELTGD